MNNNIQIKPNQILILCIVLSFLIAPLVSVIERNSKEVESETSPAQVVDPAPAPEAEEKEEETVVYEGTTVIISCDDAFTEEDLNALLKKYDLQIKYTYSMMHGYALSASYKLNEKAAKKLINDLLKEEGIVSAELDHETKIDDPVTYDK